MLPAKHAFLFISNVSKKLACYNLYVSVCIYNYVLKWLSAIVLLFAPYHIYQRTVRFLMRSRIQVRLYSIPKGGR